MRCSNAGVFRYEPKSQKFEVYVSFGFANPHGHAFDRWGQDIVVDGTGSVPTHGTLFSGHLDYPAQARRPAAGLPAAHPALPGHRVPHQPALPRGIPGQPARPQRDRLPGHSPLQDRGQGRQPGRHRARADPLVARPELPAVRYRGRARRGDLLPRLAEPDHRPHAAQPPRSQPRPDPRPGLPGHLRRPAALEPPRIAGASIEELLDLLKQPEDRVRYRARTELGARDAAQVIAALKTWVARLDKADPDYEHHLTEALWAHQYQDVVNLELLDRVLASTDFHARAAATRVLCVWRDRVPEALETLKKLAADPYPLVRLEAVRAASFFPVAEAVEVPLISADHPTDEYLDYTRGETMKTLEPYWRKAIAEGKPIAVTSEAGTRFFLGRLSIDELLKMKRTRAIDLELLLRKGVREEIRREALADLAKLDKKPELTVLIEPSRPSTTAPATGTTRSPSTSAGSSPVASPPS